MMKIVIFSFLGSVCFLYTLNLFLRGSMKQLIEAVLSLLIVATIIASFFVIGWRWGLVAVASSFVLIGLFRPLAQAAAYRFLGYRTGVDDKPELMDCNQRRERLSTLANKPPISLVLQKHNVTLDEYEDIFNTLWCSGLHDLAWEIVSTQRDLDSLIEMNKKGASDTEIWSHFRAIR